jgi:DNA (cytosine-5)-methyltransferase 1
MLTFLSIADKFRPKWVVWENVPGVLSSNGGKDFGTFLGALGELGYGFAYRVLDAQYFGVAQRRRRVFVVGYLGDWRVAAAVLFERESLQGNTKPSRKKREEVASDAQGSVGTTVFAGNKQSEIAATLQTTCDNYSRADGFNVIIDRAAFNQGENAQYEPRIETGETMSSLVAKGPHAVAQPIPVLAGEHPQKGVSIDVCPTLPAAMGMGGGHTPLVPHHVAQPIAFEPGKMQRLGYGYSDNGTSPTLRSEPGDNQLAVAQPLYYESHPNDSRVNGPKDVADTVSARYGTGGGNTPLVQQPIAIQDVRPIEKAQNGRGWNDDGTSYTVDTKATQGVAQPIAVDTYNYTTNDHTTQTIRSQSDTEHIGAVLQPIAVDVYNQSINGQTSATITEAVGGTNTSGPKVMQPMAFDWQSGGDMRGMNLQEKTQLQRCQTPAVMQAAGFLPTQGSAAKGIGYEIEQAPTLRAGCDNYGLHHPPMAIRRLTPKECERLQGFPDDWTKIPYRNKEADQCPDGPRYKACGNSMAVPVMRWIGERINLIESML